MAECGGLENRYGVTPIKGSNPLPSAPGGSRPPTGGVLAPRSIRGDDRSLPLVTLPARSMGHVGGTAAAPQASFLDHSKNEHRIRNIIERSGCASSRLLPQDR